MQEEEASGREAGVSLEEHKPNKFRADNLGTASDAEKLKNKFLLEVASSRSINVSLCLVCVALLFSFVYIFIVVTTAVSRCSTEISSYGHSTWFDAIFIPPKDSVEQLSGASALARNVLEIQAQRKGFGPRWSGRQAGTVPWCAFCSVKELSFLRGLEEEQNIHVMPLSDVWNKTGSDFAGDMINFVLGDDLSPSISLTCSLSVLLQYYSVYVGSLYLAFDASIEDLYNSSARYNLYGPGMWCLLGGGVSPNGTTCSVCGDPEAMMIQVNVARMTFLDHLDNNEYSLLEAPRLDNRCREILARSFTSECILPDNSTKTIFIDELELEKTLDSDTVQGVNIGIGSGGKGRINVNGNALKGGFISSNQTGTPFYENSRNIRRSFLGDTLGFSILSSNCTMNSNAKETIYSLVVDAPKERSMFLADAPAWVSDKSRFVQVGVCWTAYSMFFYWEPHCFQKIKNAIASSSSTFFKDTNELDLPAFALLLSLYLDNIITATSYRMEPPLNTTVQEGFDTLDFIARMNDGAVSDPLFLSTVGFLLGIPLGQQSVLFPNTEDAFDELYGECLASMERAPQELDTVMGFLSEIASCMVPVNQLKAGWIIESICSFLVLVVLGMQLLWYIFGPRTRFSLANLLFLLSAFFLINIAYLVGGLFKMDSNEIILALFFNTTGRAEHELQTIAPYLTCSSCLGLALFYLAFVFTVLNIPEKNSVPSSSTSHMGCPQPKNRAFFHVVVAVIYFCVRFFIGYVALATSMGSVPFVGLITMGRICMLDDVTPFPRCNSPNVDEVYGARPFIGICIIVVADLIAVTLASAEWSKCERKVGMLSFSTERANHLLLAMFSLLSRTLFYGAFLAAILYCSLVNIILGYDGVFAVHVDANKTSPNDLDGSALFQRSNLSLKQTGVQHWQLGFSLMLLVYTFGWLMFLSPVSTWIGKLLIHSFSGDIGRAEFFSVESELLSVGRIGPSLLFDQLTFCLETVFESLMMTHTTYHINRTEDGSSYLPAGYHVLDYIECETKDTHCLVVATPSKVYVAFRGTVSRKNAMTDLNLRFATLRWDHEEDEEESGLRSPAASNKRSFAGTTVESAHERARVMLEQYQGSGKGRAKVHRGFLEAFQLVQHRILAAVLRYTNNLPSSSPPLIITTGHSLGGGLACLAGAYLSSAVSKSIVQVVTFGAPRVGNHSFRIFFKQRVSSCWRVVKRGDPIPKTPFRRPCSKRSTYEHVGVEVLVDTTGNLLIDPSILEHALLQRWRRGSGTDHKALSYVNSFLLFSLRMLPEFNGVDETTRPPKLYRPAPWPNIVQRLRDITLSEKTRKDFVLIEQFLDSCEAELEQEIKLEQGEESEPDEQEQVQVEDTVVQMNVVSIT